MQLMKLNSIYAELRGDSWFDSEKSSLEEELHNAMFKVMPEWLLAQADQLVEELYALDRGDTENEDRFFMIDMDLFRSGMLDAHRYVMKQRNQMELAWLDNLEGNDEVIVDDNDISWLDNIEGNDE